ncbi:hypothetical protein DFQ28_005974 [Apophysomyces sp. BC1034]|nr:hypothetical protein DFQ30_006022 [Apophysomyces sp. BC1015]KAG0182703.1 hypothetical protein DFQ29_002623 [Apophysomyces sp. BC1021]KAG0187681.1 hypothetical protein DFQ28_005974 [Apophysomyces sp. BC1034]
MAIQGEKAASVKKCSNTQTNFKPTFYNPFEIKHRRRTSRAQFRVLEKAFQENPKPNTNVRQSLAQRLSMTPRGVQIWFQNRRAKAKSQKQQHHTHEDHQIVQNFVHRPLMPSLHSTYSSSSHITTTTSGKNDTHVPDPLAYAQPKVHPYVLSSQQSDTSTTYDDDDSLQEHSSVEDQLVMTPMTPHQISPFVIEPANIQGLEGGMTSLVDQQTFCSVKLECDASYAKDISTPASDHATIPLGHEYLFEPDMLAYLNHLGQPHMPEAMLLGLPSNNTSLIGSPTSGSGGTRPTGLAYNGNVADWIQTVPTHQTMSHSNGDDVMIWNMQPTPNALNAYCSQDSQSKNQETMLRRHSAQPRFMPYQDKAYWNGHQIMRRLSEPVRSIDFDLLDIIANSPDYFVPRSLATSVSFDATSLQESQ